MVKHIYHGPGKLSWFFLLSVGFCTCITIAEAASVGDSNQQLISEVHQDIDIQVFPPANAQPVDTCPDAVWKEWKLHRTPSDFDPLNWTRQQWIGYAKGNLLRSSSISIAFLLLGLLALLAALTWRTVQWLAGCGICRRCLSLGSEDTTFLGDTKHTYLRGLMYLMIAGALIMTAWGMTALDRHVVETSWGGAAYLLSHGNMAAHSMRSLQELTASLPPKLQSLSDTVSSTVSPSQLASDLQEGLSFAASVKVPLTSLLSATADLRSGLDDGILPSLQDLLVQMGVGQDEAAGDTSNGDVSTAIDSMAELLTALGEGLPRITSAEAARETRRGALQSLQAAIDLLSSDSTAAPLAISLALKRVTLAAWDSQLQQLREALQAYNATAEAITYVVDSATRLSQGASALAPSTVAQVLGNANRVGQDYRDGQDALQSLLTHLAIVRTEVLDTADWVLVLGNGTTAEIEAVAGALKAGFNDLLPLGDATVALKPPTSSATFVQASLNSSRIVTDLVTSIKRLSTAAANVAAAARSGPDPTAARDQIETSWRPALSALASPLAGISTAMALYNQDPSSSNLELVRSSAADAGPSLNLAITILSVPLASASTLAAAAVALQSPVVALASVNAVSKTPLAKANEALTGISSGAMANYQSRLIDLISLIAQLPVARDAAAALSATASRVTDQVSLLSNAVAGTVANAARALDAATVRLKDEIISRGERLRSKYQSDSERIADLVHPVWMGAWGLCALLLLVLAVGVSLNWPGGLVLGGLLLLAVITASQVLTVTLSAGMSALQDTCSQLEAIAIREFINETSDVPLAAALSYYAFNVPDSQDAMFATAFGLDVPGLSVQLQAASMTLVRRVRSDFSIRGTTGILLDNLESTTVTLMDQLGDVLQLTSYDSVQPLYAGMKETACCAAGLTAYHQWCATTAMAALSFCALVIAAYLLARMDMLGDRQGCGSCAACVCYRPRRVEKPAEEDNSGFMLQMATSKVAPSSTPSLCDTTDIGAGEIDRSTSSLTDLAQTSLSAPSPPPTMKP